MDSIDDNGVDNNSMINSISDPSVLTFTKKDVYVIEDSMEEGESYTG